jgi:hypothetical protein
MLIQLLHGGLEVVGGFKFNKPFFHVNGGTNKRMGEYAQDAMVTHPLPCSRPVSE